MPKITTLLLLVALLAACAPAPAEPTATTTAAPATETAQPSATPTAAGTATPTDRPAPVVEVPGIEFTFYQESEPIIANGASDHWTGKWMNPGGVVFHDGLFHMYMNAFHIWPGVVSIGHYTSTDGYDWRLAESNPIFTSDDIPYLNADRGADVSTALVTEDGTWVLYFHVVKSGRGAGIGRATAPGPNGPWSFDEGPVLEKGDGTRWDSSEISWPSVVQTEGGYVMYYVGRDFRGNSAIGMATSPDGSIWTKYDDPATTDDLYAESDPVLVANKAWEGDGLDRPRVVLTEDGWVMLYAAAPPPSINPRGLAFSEDGIHWTRLAATAVFNAGDFNHIDTNMWDTNLFYHEGVYFWYMEIGSLANTQIYLSTFEGSLTP